MRLLFKVVSLICVCYTGSVFSEELSFPHIVTTGYGEISVVPDSAIFSAEIEKTTMNADQAKDSVDEIVENFLNRLYKIGVNKEDISSSNLYLAPQYYYPKDSQAQLMGYKARRTITVNVNNLSQLNNHIDTAIDAGINRIQNIQLKVKDDQKYIEQARLNAIMDANQKAQSLAKGFKRSLGSVWQIAYRNRSSSPMLMKALSTQNQAENSSYQDATIEIKDSVDVIYKLN